MATGQKYRQDLIFFEEGTYGTMGTAGYKLRINSVTPSVDQPIITNEVITGNRLTGTPFRDVKTCGVSFTLPMYLDEIGWIQKHAIGDPASAGSDPYTHTSKVGYSGASIGDLPAGCSFEIGTLNLDTPLYHQFWGGRINEIVIPFGAGGPAQIQCTAVCSDHDPDATSRKHAGFTSYTTDALSQTDISAITEGGGDASAVCLGGEIRLNNNLDGSMYMVGGGGVISELPTGRASVTGSIRLAFKDDTYIDKLEAFTESSLGVTWTSGTHSWALTVPEIKYNNSAPVPGSGSGLIHDVTWEAFYGNHADATLLKAVLTNSVSDYPVP
jgi:hypothetical protein